MDKDNEEKLSPPDVFQIKECKSHQHLREWREYLMTNVKRLMEEKYMEWKVWEDMINRIDAKLHDMPITIDLVEPGKAKRYRV